MLDSPNVPPNLLDGKDPSVLFADGKDSWFGAFPIGNPEEPDEDDVLDDRDEKAVNGLLDLSNPPSNRLMSMPPKPIFLALMLAPAPGLSVLITFKYYI